MSKNIYWIFSTLLILIFFSKSTISVITGLDTDVIVDLMVLNGKSSSQSCPSGYTPASGCENEMCDLNYNAGGNYIYLCLKKVLFNSLSSNQKPINKLKVNYNNKDCGNLRLIDSDLNAKAGGEYIYFCYGYDENDEEPSPISDIFISIPGRNTVPEGYDCELSDLNKGSWRGQQIFACYQKNKLVPKSVEYSDLTFDYNGKTLYEIENPEDSIYINNDNTGGNFEQSIQRKITKYKETSYSFNFNQSFSFIETFSSINPISLLISGQTSFKAQFDEKESEGNIHITKVKEEIEYFCNAGAGQHLMCKAFNTKFKLTIPYQIIIVYHYYDGKKETEKYQSELTGVMGSSIQFSKCCIKGCQRTDNICSQEEIDLYDSLSGSCPKKNNFDEYNNFTNFGEAVITDLSVLTSKSKYVNCPYGYELINSGCDIKGCDLNYFAGGNYIYLCQKRQKMIGLSQEENPIDTVEILFNSKDCDNSLKLIDINLNEGAGGDNIRLCYGRKNNYFLEPIVDFFVYIEDLNDPPEGYDCYMDKNLNNGTTKGKITYLCYTRNYSAYLLKLEKENGKGMDSNLELVTGLSVVNSNGKEISCPNGYTKVNSGCDSDGCDLNAQAGGDYIYICQRKQKLNSNLSLNQKPINSVKIVFNKNDYQNLNLIDRNLNQGSGGYNIYIRYGYNPEESLPPIVDFFVHILKMNNPPEGYECDSTDLNKGAGGAYIYLCYKRDYNVPKEIIINNLDLYYNLTRRISIGLPEKITEIKVNSGSLTQKIEKTVEEERYLQTYFSNYFYLDVSFSLFTLIELGYNLNYTTSTSEEWRDIVSKTLSTEIQCKAEERKTMMCIPFLTSFQEIIPYKADVSFIDYQGNLLSKGEYFGNYEKMTTSQISYKVCCLDGCCTGNKLLDANKPQCTNNEKDILCSDIQECFYE